MIAIMGRSNWEGYCMLPTYAVCQALMVIISPNPTFLFNINYIYLLDDITFICLMIYYILSRLILHC